MLKPTDLWNTNLATSRKLEQQQKKGEEWRHTHITETKAAIKFWPPSKMLVLHQQTSTECTTFSKPGLVDKWKFLVTWRKLMHFLFASFAVRVFCWYHHWCFTEASPASKSNALHTRQETSISGNLTFKNETTWDFISLFLFLHSFIKSGRKNKQGYWKIWTWHGILGNLGSWHLCWFFSHPIITLPQWL